jgi:RND family efflux transporter MFP subunit
LPVKIHHIEIQSSYVKERVFIGRVEAGRLSDSGFEIGGNVSEIKVDEGYSVKEDDILATLDTDRLEAARKEAAAALQEARATLSLSESTLKRVKAAVKIKAVSRQELDEAQETRNTAEATVNRQKAALERIEVDIKKSTLKAPFDGIITKRLVDEGRVIAAGMPVLTLQEKTAAEARIALANGLADQFKEGQNVNLSIYSDKVNATVKSVLPVRDGRSWTVDVIFSLDKDALVRPGDLAELKMGVSIETKGAWVPLSALTETVRGLWSVYTIDEAETAQRKAVEILYQNESQAFVRSNLSQEESIIADGAHRIVPGQRVEALPYIKEGKGEVQ